MQELNKAVAWVTGAGSGIGEAAALALAKEGVTVIMTGRRRHALDAVAEQIKAQGGTALVEPGDLTHSETVATITARITQRFGRLDILVNNAGLNVQDRSWAKLAPAGIDTVIGANLSSAFYCVCAVLPVMRAQKNGLLIHTASWAGRFVGLMPGPAYVAAKHGVVAMSHSINMEECVNGIRSCVLCPAEVATPILDQRPVPVSKADRDQMLQPEDLGAVVVFIARQPARVCINEIVISPTWNRGYVAARNQPHVKL